MLAKTAWAVVPVRKIRVTGLAISRLSWDSCNRERSKGLEKNYLRKNYFILTPRPLLVKMHFSVIASFLYQAALVSESGPLQVKPCQP